MLGRAIESRGHALTTLCVPRVDLNEIEALEPDLLVVMGGPIGVYQAEDYPFIRKEQELLRRRIEKDLPTIGICLGSQLMASAMGARVYPGPQGPELGWHKLSLTPEGENSPARHFAPDKTSMMHWHGDTFDLPDGAVLLASSTLYKNQIYQIGRNALGIQCHPELRRERLREWEVMFVNQVTGPEAVLPLERWRADTARHVDDMNRQSALFFNEWMQERGF